MFKTKILLAALLAGAAWAPAMAATEPANPVGQGDPGAAPPSQLRKSSVVAKLPYSATETVTHHRVLADGNEIKTETVRRIYRDGAGRTRKEMVSGDSRLGSVEISDADGEMYLLDPVRKTAVKPAMMTMTIAHKKDGNDVKVAGQGVTAERLEKFTRDTLARSKLETNRVFKDLGVREIEGFKARGHLTTYEIAADAAGNRHTIEVWSETWMSPDLRVSLYSKRSDPRTGETVTALSNIERGEPDASLFAIPDDYKLTAPRIGLEAD